ncbi:hypothetical protein GCM10009304_29440 [Pseudomonas matsuisoli]|uniref:Uncharacterized protein n=1 Tax=Pseudomonas matsuisoli TaxID=1515666 RepID=A0A917PZE2_9PSED|nr:hypothetical protein GCM10009304_29440 [Pseudomonas matsuisoli]
MLDQDPEYKQVFEKGVAYGGADNNEGPSNIDITWYAVPLPADIPNGQAEDPEYGNLMQGIGTFRYEVNSESRNAQGETTRLRSTTAKVFN